MANTPIYNWPTPDNTDLVKNGALAIRTLGDAIDTTMDTMIPETIFAAKGDLLGASANDTPAVLTVGANGETLVADSSATTGLRYSATPSASNPVLNSAMQNWQRGTTVSGAGGGAYTADRWFLYAGSNGTVSRQATGDTTNLPNIQYAARVGRLVSVSDTTAFPFSQSFESVNSIPFAGKTVTLSFYARKGADYSPASSALGVVLATGTGTDQNYSSAGYTGSATPISQTATLTTTWQRFTYSATLSASLTELAVSFTYTPVGTAGAADYFEVTGVQIDVGSVALPFRTYAATIQGELAACQRYYYRTSDTGAFANYGMGYADQTNSLYASVKLPVSMRVKPTSLDYSSLCAHLYNVSATALGTVTLESGSLSRDWGVVLGSATGLTQFRPYGLNNNNTTSGYIGFSAEL
jgi:hypothetical protein